MDKVVENKLVDMLDALQNGVIEIGNQTLKYAPDIQQALLAVVRVDALQHLVYGVVAAIVVKWSYESIKKGCELNKQDKYSVDGAGHVIAGVMLGVFSLVSVTFTLLDVWCWAGLFDPKIYLAHKLLDKVF